MNRFKKAITSEQTALIFLLKLLILLCVVKSIFFIYNYQNNHGWEIQKASNVFSILLWSLYYDAVCISLVSIPFFTVALFRVKPTLLFIAAALSVFLIVFSLILNIADVFYFPFHRQRANADLFYVLKNPFNYSGSAVWLIVTVMLVFAFVACRYFWTQYKKIVAAKLRGTSFFISFLLPVIILGSLLIGHSKKMIPTRPLTDLNAVQVPLAQNSFHTLLYSVYRSKESSIPLNVYFTKGEQNAFFSINKKNSHVAGTPRNIILFIMESVPGEFLDPGNIIKPAFPFLDSLLEHATYYNNAFSYSYSSNKGITALLTGIPTITDIPLYHSGFASIHKTAVGKMLEQKNYSSSFFIGDNYDDFGFAKCCNWAGIQQYYCMQNIAGYKKMEKHSMGLQDEYVLNFMQQQLQQQKSPFFSTFYNISTHYPNDLTNLYKKKLANIDAPAPVKSMMYYDDCLKQFFKEASTRSWFKNTVFIFSSDHWANPGNGTNHNDIVNSFRIPVFIFDPAVNKKQVISNTVSQLDIMNTVLAYAGIKAPITGYGNSLLDTVAENRTVFTKINNSVYQAINNEYVLGFDADEEKRLYCYNYITDIKRAKNILPGKFAAADSLELHMKAFLQTAASHYRDRNNFYK